MPSFPIKYRPKKDNWSVRDGHENARRDVYVCDSEAEAKKAVAHLKSCDCCWHWRAACLNDFLTHGDACESSSCVTCDPSVDDDDDFADADFDEDD